MKTTILILLAATASLHGQGTLLPLGAPAPTMKTLDQLQPRTDLATVVGDANSMHVITEPGSYYLSGNLDVTTENGIFITSGAVTLDLMGFNLFRSSTAPASGAAITISVPDGITNIVVKDGNITSGVTYNPGATGDQYTGPGFNDGLISAGGSKNIRATAINVAGCKNHGINLQTSSATVENCSVSHVGGLGIGSGDVHNCTVYQSGGIGIFARGNVSSSWASTVAGGSGIQTSGTVSNSYGSSTGVNFAGNDGIRASNVKNSYGIVQRALTGPNLGVDSDGIDATYSVDNSFGSSFGGKGINAANVSNSYGTAGGDQPGSNGIDASQTVQNSFGRSEYRNGIAAKDVSDCYGLTNADSQAGRGIDASHTVFNSTGYATDIRGGDGIKAAIASYSSGYTNGNNLLADGIDANLVIACRAVGGLRTDNQYLMP